MNKIGNHPNINGFVGLASAHAQHCLLLKQLQALFQISSEVALAAGSDGESFEALAAGPHCEGVDDDLALNQNARGLLH